MQCKNQMQHTTDTQINLATIQLVSRRSSIPIVSATLIPSVVAPWLRETGLPCIASPETLSYGNTQQLGTEKIRFIDASGSEFILQQLARPSGTHGAAEQYVHYLVNIKGPRN